MTWRTVTGRDLVPPGSLQLETLLKGVFDKHRLLDLIRNFLVFEDDGEKVTKKLAGYHQFHAVNKAVATTVEASRATGDRRAGVIWHTQGSGKSLSMVFYAGKIVQHPAMENPTIVMLTDRNDLDDQLFDTFSFCKELLRQIPVQAESRDHLRKLLDVASGGVVFTTIQKFFPDEKGGKHPLLSDRRNIVVIADEAHRSQYDFIDGFAKHMRDALPKASFIGFTGTPIESGDKNTQAVFGDYIDVYDILQSKEDKATVPIYYEARLAKIDLKPEERPKIDPNFEEVTEDAEESTKESLRRKWAQLEAMVGMDKRIALVAEDLVKHWEARYDAMEGKAMVVCMSRRICVELYKAIEKLRPDWHHDDDDKGVMKIVMSGSASDKLDWQKHIRSKKRREELAKMFKNPKKPFRIVIVRDMWLTGFDAPSLHTMYVDKPMRSHGLMQAIARVNRVFKDKPGGLVVDYLGLAEELKQALGELLAPKKLASLCDVACGPGHLALSFAGKVPRIVGVDAAPNMLQQFQRLAQERGVNVEAIQAFAEKIPLPPDSFDAVVSRLAPHHFLDPAKAVEEMARLAKRGGSVAVIDLEANDDPVLDALHHEIEVLHDPTHVRSYSAPRWRQYFERAGLTVEVLESGHTELPGGLSIQGWCDIGNTEAAAREKIYTTLKQAPMEQLSKLGIRLEDGEFYIPVRTLIILGQKKWTAAV